MSNILLTRIDSRLCHGSLIEIWSKQVDFDTVVIANDRVEKDLFSQELMKSTIDKDIDLVFLKTRDLKTYLNGNIDKKIFLLVETTDDLIKIINDKVKIDQVDVGVIHLSLGKKLLTEQVAVDKKDLDNFSSMVDKGMDVYIQEGPFSRKKPIKEFFI